MSRNIGMCAVQIVTWPIAAKEAPANYNVQTNECDVRICSCLYIKISNFILSAGQYICRFHYGTPRINQHVWDVCVCARLARKLATI